MDTALLSKTARAMVAPGKGLLAADESAGTCKKRFDSVNVECTEENRRAYREMLFTTPGIEQYVSGVILFDETLRQKTKDGVTFAEYLKNGILPGIKVDAGAEDMALHPGREGHRGPRQAPRAHGRVLQAGRALRQVARRDHHRRGHPDPRLPRGQRARARPLLGDLPGGLDRPHRRARGAARRHPLRRAQRRVHQDTLATLFHELARQDVLRSST